MQTATYRLTIADLVDSRAYAYNSLTVVKVMRLIPFVIVLGALLPGAWQVLQGNWSEVDIPAPLLVLGLVLVFWNYVGNRLLLPGSARKQLARSIGLQDDIVISWDADRIVLESSHSRSEWPWSHFYQWQESPGSILLWQGPQLYSGLPKRVLTADQISEIRGCLTTALGKPGKRRK